MWRHFAYNESGKGESSKSIKNLKQSHLKRFSVSCEHFLPNFFSVCAIASQLGYHWQLFCMICFQPFIITRKVIHERFYVVKNDHNWCCFNSELQVSDSNRQRAEPDKDAWWNCVARSRGPNESSPFRFGKFVKLAGPSFGHLSMRIALGDDELRNLLQWSSCKQCKNDWFYATDWK